MKLLATSLNMEKKNLWLERLGYLSTLFQLRPLLGFRHIFNCLVLIFTWISHWYLKLNMFNGKLITFTSKYASLTVFSVSVNVFMPIQLKHP